MEYRTKRDISFLNLMSDFETNFGKLYQSDCLEVLPAIESESVDLVFADPPFNLNKFYGNGINDKKKDVEALIQFCKFAPSKVNLIEYNPIDDGEFKQATNEVLENYINTLEKNRIVVNVRRSRGKDIDAACGQLANKE